MSYVLFAVFVAVLCLVPGIGMIVGGRAALRKTTPAHRVPVDAVVVDYSQHTGATGKWVTFDYPVPDGTWLRARRLAGLIEVQMQGPFVRPGDRLRVYVNPANPVDVSLGQTGGATGLVGLALIIFGALLILIGLGFAARMLSWGVG